MRYYIGNLSFDSDYIEHYGVKGMRWGKRKARGKRNIISDWWTGRDHIRNVAGLMEANKRLRENYEQQDSKRRNKYDSLSEGHKSSAGNNPVADIKSSKKTASQEVEKYRKAPRQVIAKAIRRGKTKISYTLGKIKRGETYSKTSKRIKEKGKSLITKYFSRTVEFDLGGTKFGLKVSPFGDVTEATPKKKR